MKQKEKRDANTILLVVMLVAGLMLLVYPTASNYWNSFHQSNAIAKYAREVAETGEDERRQILRSAYAYNQKLAESGIRWFLTEEEEKEYSELLDLTKTGIMGYIDIPKIACHLPIYHGTEDGVLQIAVGHIEGSSLPVGGESSHCILSGHRGLPSAKLFTELDEMENGDLFTLNVMGEVLTYAVDQIVTVVPNDLSELKIEKGKDLCTLVTCTPYGINTHRLLVRGHRVANVEEVSGVRIAADAVQMDPLIVALVIATFILGMILLGLVITTRRKKK